MSSLSAVRHLGFDRKQPLAIRRPQCPNCFYVRTFSKIRQTAAELLMTVQFTPLLTYLPQLICQGKPCETTILRGE